MGKQIIVKSLFFIALLGYALVPSFAQAQQPGVQVSARTDTDRIRIGEQIKLILSASIPTQGGNNVIFPQFLQPLGSSKPLQTGYGW